MTCITTSFTADCTPIYCIVYISFWYQETSNDNFGGRNNVVTVKKSDFEVFEALDTDASHSICSGSMSEYLEVIVAQPRSQALPSPERKTLVGSGHMAPRLWVVTNKINVEDVLKIDSCSYLA